VSLATGTVYGWPALRRDLIRSGDLSESQLGAIFTAGAWSVQGGRFFAGFKTYNPLVDCAVLTLLHLATAGLARDAFGTMRTVIVILTFVIVGTLLIATAGPSDVLSLACGMFMLGLGSGAQLCVQPVAELFPGNPSAFMASLSGAFQISGMVFLVLLSVGTRSGAFKWYAVAVFVLLLFSAWLLPREGSFVATREEEGPTVARFVVGCEEELSPREVTERTEGKGNGTTKSGQLQSTEYAALLLWFSIAVTPAQFYVLSIGYQLEFRGDDEGTYMRIFLLIYALGFLVSPLFGMLADKFGMGVSHGLSASFLALALGFLALPYDWPIDLQIAGFIFYSVGRLSVWGMFFSNIGRRFGYENFGLLAGSGLLVSAVVSVLQYPLYTLAINGNLRSVNIGLVVALIATFPYAAWLRNIEIREKWSEIREKQTPVLGVGDDSILSAATGEL